MTTIPQLSFKGDLSRLIESRVLVQANSGGGKSYALRSLLEQTHGRVQQFIIDPEGEFATLREAFDYVLVAHQGGDVQASPRTAKMLCRRLVELGASAVLDLYDLPLHERREFVRLFLGELMAIPRALWHPILVVIDEAHVFCPERGSGESQSTEAVISLCTQGRKRGFCAVLATQRISKLHKDAAAELLNKLIGRTGLDVDVDRAARELGFDKVQRLTLPRLEPRQFYVYGPAASNTVTLMRTMDTRTHKPASGAAGSIAPPPPEKVRAVLAKLGDLPKEAAEEARTITELKQENAALRGKMTRLERQEPTKIVEKTVVDQEAIARAEARAYERAVRDTAHAALDAVLPLRREMEKMSGRFVEALQGSWPKHTPAIPAPTHTPLAVTRPVAPRREPTNGNHNGSLPKGERAVLIAIASYPDGVDRDQLSVLTGYKRSSRDAYVSRALARSHVEVNGSRILATEEGIAALGSDFEPLPTGEALREHWANRLPEGERKILEALMAVFPDPLPREALDDATGYKRSSRDAYISRLKARRLVTIEPSGIAASATLFES